MPYLEDISGIQQARNAGYSDDEIYGHLATKRPDWKSAQDAGYSFPEVYQHVFNKAQDEARGLQEKATGITSPIGGTTALATGALKLPDKATEVAQDDEKYKGGLTQPAGSEESVAGNLGGAAAPDRTVAESAEDFGSNLLKPGGGFLPEVNLPEGLPQGTNILGKPFSEAAKVMPSGMKPLLRYLSGAADIPERTAEDLTNFASSPAGVAAMGAGAASPLARQALATVFAAQAIHDAPDQVREFANAGTPEERAEAFRKLLMGTMMVAGGIHETFARPEGEVRAAKSEQSVAPLKEAAAQAASIAPEAAHAANHLADVIEAKQTSLETAVKPPEGVTPPAAPLSPPPQVEPSPAPAVAERTAADEQAGTGTVTPAIQLPSGEVFTGDDHVSAYAKAKETIPDTSGSKEGFVDDSGKFVSREEAADQTGLPTNTEPGKLHSSDLPDETENPIPPTEPVPVASSVEAPDESVQRDGGATPAAESPLTYKPAAVDDFLKSLGEEEPAPKSEPAEEPRKPAAEMSKEETISALQKELDQAVADKRTRDTTRLRKRIKELSKEEKPEEPRETPAVEKTEQPAEKERWQKTRDEVKAEGGSRAAHRVAVREAVKRGEQVPLETLEDFQGSEWADKARRKLYGEQISDSFLTKIISGLHNDAGAIFADPLFIQSVGKPAMRLAVKALQESIEAGKLGADGITDAVAYLKSKLPDLNEEEARDWFERTFFERAEPAAKSAQEELKPTTPSGRAVEDEGVVTSTKHATTEAERSARGATEREQQGREDIGETWDKAREAMEASKNRAPDLVEELSRKPRATTALEEAILLRHKVSVMNELDGHIRRALDESEDAGDRQEARVQSARLMDELNDIDRATSFSGSETGRSLRFRQVLAAEDYSLVKMLQKKQLAMGDKWDGMNETEKAKVTEQVKTMHDRIEKLEKDFHEHEQRVAAELEKRKNADVDKAIEAMAKPQTPAEKYVQGLVEKIQAGLNKQAEAALARIKARRAEGRLSSLPVNELIDYGIYGASKLFSTGIDLAKWGAEMVKDLGEDVKPYLEEIFAKSQEINNEAIEKGAPKKYRDVVKPKNEEEARKSIVDTIERKRGAKEAIGTQIQKLAEHFVRSGITDREKLIEAVHAAVKESLPDATPRDIRDAISGYGDFKELSKDEIKAKLRDLKGQMQQVSKIEDIKETGKAQKTGVQRREPSAEERNLMKEVNRVKKEYGIDTDDPEALKSAMATVKTRLKNRIEDLQQAIAKKEKLPAKGKKLVDDEELKQLRNDRDAIQKEYDTVFGEPNPTPEQIAADKAQKGVDAAAAALDRWDRIAKGEIAPEAKSAKEPGSNLEEELRAQTEAIKQAVRESNRKPTDEQAKQIKALENATEEYLRRVAAGEIAGKGKIQNRPDTELVSKARDARDAAKKILDDLRKSLKPKLTPDQIALKAYKTRVQKRIADSEDRVKRGDFSKTPRKTVTLDREGMALKDKVDAAKFEYDKANARDIASRRGALEKFIDAVPKWSRAALLSNPITLGKLTMAAILRTASTPLEEAVGAVVKHVPVVSDVAARAPRHGYGLNVRAEAKALTDGIMQGMKDSADLFKTGETGVTRMAGNRNIQPRALIDMIGTLHGVLKAPVKRMEFERSFQQRTEFAMRNGVDVTDPMVQTRLMTESAKDALRATFEQDNAVVNAWKAGIAALKQKDPKTGEVPLRRRALAALRESLVPVVKIPTNIAAEIAEYAVGSVTGSVRMGRAFAKGMENLSPEEADSIMRQLKKGSIGGAALLLGYYTPQIFGGLYQPGEHRRDSEAPAGGMKLYGAKIPSWTIHAPVTETIQLGATIRRVADSKLRKKDSVPQGLWNGVTAAALGLTDEVPFVRDTTEISKLFGTPEERQRYLWELGKSRLIPQAVQFAASQSDKPQGVFGDTAKRNPRTFGEELKTGVPGLRQQVPLKRSSRNRAYSYRNYQ